MRGEVLRQVCRKVEVRITPAYAGRSNGIALVFPE